MVENARQAYADWKKADAEARQAESNLQAAWRAYEMGGRAPSEQTVNEVYRLRAIAQEKLNAAVAALGAAASKSKS